MAEDMGPQLLTREGFRAGVFARDGHRCVLCGAPGIDAHHILDRKLFPDGGYYLDNGATLCGDCHRSAEASQDRSFSPVAIRQKAGILATVLPPGYDPGIEYDKWGTPVIDDPSKYPHTPHLPWSPGFDKQEDMILASTGHWEGTEVVITEKMDGEGTSIYRDNFHARSTSYAPHPSRSRMRAIWGSVRHEIPLNWRICGENVSARHSIGYTDLPSYFLVFSVWDRRTALAWDDTVEWCQLLGLDTVPVLWRDTWSHAKCYEITCGLDLDRHEGIVVRPAGGFEWEAIASQWGPLGKWVRRGHVTTDEHWMKRPVEWNGLRGAR
jgi:hypothetical protein